MAFKDKAAEQAYQKSYRAKHSEKVKSYNKAYRAAHKDEILKKQQEYREAHREELLIKQKIYRNNHLDEEKARKKSYNAAHREEETRKKASYKKVIICAHCGKRSVTDRYKHRIFCSYRCSRMGPNNPQWKGGISYEPYCIKFTKYLKEEIRDKFGHRCFLCHMTEEMNGCKLSIHHCDYLKSQGCQGQRWSLLPLCKQCHAKTNTRRWYWFALLRDYWIYDHICFERSEWI
jgi:hypothetical protein